MSWNRHVHQCEKPYITNLYFIDRLRLRLTTNDSPYHKHIRWNFIIAAPRTTLASVSTCGPKLNTDGCVCETSEKNRKSNADRAVEGSKLNCDVRTTAVFFTSILLAFIRIQPCRYIFVRVMQTNRPNRSNFKWRGAAPVRRWPTIWPTNGSKLKW